MGRDKATTKPTRPPGVLGVSTSGVRRSRAPEVSRTAPGARGKAVLSSALPRFCARAWGARWRRVGVARGGATAGRRSAPSSICAGSPWRPDAAGNCNRLGAASWRGPRHSAATAWPAGERGRQPGARGSGDSRGARARGAPARKAPHSPASLSLYFRWFRRGGSLAAPFSAGKVWKDGGRKSLKLGSGGLPQVTIQVEELPGVFFPQFVRLVGPAGNGGVRAPRP